MNKKTPAEMQRHKVTKATRTLVRLKHSLAADEELNSVLPDTLEQFDTALANGELKELVAGLDDVIKG
jgi:arginine/lysine/ornithine decarboxylase